MAVDYEKEGRIALFTINRPEKMNALNSQAVKELHDAMVDFQNDNELWVGVVTGAGEKAFCCGADVQDLFSSGGEGKEGPLSLPPTIMRGLNVWKPLIAAINGMALGGGLELALACDIRIASETARLGFPEVNLGVMPGWGGTQRLTRMIPWCKAAEILLMGKPINAQEAYRIGLINKIVPPEQVLSEAKAWAETISQVAPVAVRTAKEAMIKGYSMTLEDSLELEKSMADSLQNTEDFVEGTRAFTEKRKPNYKGR